MKIGFRGLPFALLLLMFVTIMILWSGMTMSLNVSSNTSAQDLFSRDLSVSSPQDYQKFPIRSKYPPRHENGISTVDSYEIDTSTKSVNKTQVVPGDEVTFTIVARSGSRSAIGGINAPR